MLFYYTGIYKGTPASYVAKTSDEASKFLQEMTQENWCPVYAPEIYGWKYEHLTEGKKTGCYNEVPV